MNKENQWFPDSGASNHVTHDLANLSVGTEYQRDNKVHIGNGAGLHIQNIGSSLLKSSSNTIFHLNNL